MTAIFFWPYSVLLRIVDHKTLCLLLAMYHNDREHVPFSCPFKSAPQPHENPTQTARAKRKRQRFAQRRVEDRKMTP